MARAKATSAAPLWSHEVGEIPYKVTVYEEPTRQRTLYLRWRAEANWRRKSLRRLLPRAANGRPDADTVAWAVRQADAQYQRLKGGLPAEAEARLTRPLTIAEGLARVTDPRTGRYPVKSAHRREVEAAVVFAARVWGSDRTWNSIRRADVRALWRARIQQLRDTGAIGHRGAEITVSRILTVAAWLRQEELIEPGACSIGREWKHEVRNDWRALSGETRDPEPRRPRHTLDEMLRILEASWHVDPRFGLLLTLGAELRLGQVARCRRSDYNRDAGTLQVPTSGKKRGVLIVLTGGQRTILERELTEGYLRELETALPDYPLMPQGQMRGGRKGRPVADPQRHGIARPIDRTTIREWWKAAESLGGVVHVPRRGAYGVRRLAVDEFKRRGISREGLMQAGGWADSQIPDAVYADQKAAYAAEEAARLRAEMRGEVPSQHASDVHKTYTPESGKPSGVNANQSKR